MKLKIDTPSNTLTYKGRELIQKYQYGGPSPFLSSPTNMENGIRNASKVILKGLSKIGEAFNTVITSGGYTDYGQTSPFADINRQTIHNSRIKTVDNTKQKIAEASPVLSPSSWIVGKGNPWKGVQTISTLDPRLQLLAAGVDMATLAKGRSTLRATGDVALKTLNPDVQIGVARNRVGKPLGFGKIQSTPTIQNRPAPKADPLITRLMRIQNKKDAGIIPKTDQALIIRDGQSEALIEDQIVKAYKRLGIEEDVARSAAKTTVMNNGKGVHTPVIGDDGNLIGGISYVDKQQALKALRESGITNPTEADIRTILGHELGHQVEVPIENKEIYTQMGQVLDNEGITAASPNITVDWLLGAIDRYLSQGRLDNGISGVKEKILDMKMPDAKRFAQNVGKFSGYTGGAYILTGKDN